MISIRKPEYKDVTKIGDILSQWTEKEEVEKYIQRIKNEIEGIIKYNMRFWVAVEGYSVHGVIGLSDPLPIVISFAKTSKPGEIKILYVDSEKQGRGVGKVLVSFIEQEAIKMGYDEILVRSALRYKDTAWGFYKKMNYFEMGNIKGEAKKESMQVFGKIITNRYGTS